MPKMLHSRFLLSVPAAALVVGAIAAPGVADPGNAPGGGNNDDRAQTAIEKRPPMPSQARVPDHAAARGPQKAAPPPGRPRGRAGDARPAPQAPDQAPAPQSPSAPGALQPADPPAGVSNGVDGTRGSKLGRVVVCKWVRKPGVTEIPSHVIVVNANALIGKGFAGTFPFPFSDGQFNSVAIRWAEKGESAREVDDVECTAPAALSAADLPAVSDPPQVLGLVETAPDATIAANSVADPVADRDLLPATGAREHLRAILLVGGIATLLGALLVAASRLRRSAPGT